MSIKGTSIEVIVVLVVFPSPLYGTDRSKRSQDSGFKELVIDESEDICVGYLSG